MNRRRAVGGLAARLGCVAVALMALFVAGQRGARAGGGPTGKLVYTAADGIYVLKMDGSAAQRIWTAPAGGQGTAPRWSDDGSRVVFEGPDGNIWVMSGDGSGAHAVNKQAVPGTGCGEDGCASPGTVSDSPRWSHDGASISYRLVEGLARGSIWTVPVDGSAAPQQVASSNDLCIFNEGWSPDGKPLFSRCATDGSPSNATYAAVVTQRPIVAGSQLAYSADGGRLAFSSQAVNNGVLMVSVFLSAADGSGAQMVARGGQEPAWSRDGLLAYQVGGADGGIMHVYDPASGADSIVGPGMLGGWTPDGGYLYYTTVSDSGPAIWRVRPDGSDNRLAVAGNFPNWTS